MKIAQDVKIRFHLGKVEPEFTGVVCGVATIGAAVIGEGYIVKLDAPVAGYPYTHCVVFENWITQVL